MLQRSTRFSQKCYNENWARNIMCHGNNDCNECVSGKSIKRPWWVYNVYQLRYDWHVGLDDNGNVLPIYPILIDMSYKYYYVGHDDFQGGAWVWRYVSFFGAHLTLHRLSGIKMWFFGGHEQLASETWNILLINFHPFSTHGRPCPPVTTAFTSAIVIPKRAPAPKTGPATQKMGLPPHNVPNNYSEFQDV